MVRELNANTAELKHEIRDSCGERGRQWYAALEERIEEARARYQGLFGKSRSEPFVDRRIVVVAWLADHAWFNAPAGTGRS